MPPKKSPETKKGALPLMERPISIPTKDVEALINAVASGNRTAAMDVVNARIRPMAQEQNPEVFPG